MTLLSHLSSNSMVPTRRSRKKARGYTLIEVAIVVGLMSIIASIGLIGFRVMMESRDATMVDSVQASLQTLVAQAADRVDLTPAQLMNDATQRTRLLRALDNTIDNTVTVAAGGANNQIRMTIVQSNRGATYTVDASGNAVIGAGNLTGFSHYTLNNGRIQ
jgi:prepilin-type N-terminal cleavage/methylation domain-containing protein